jgi:AbrB family looped-hinge helix DNA binding protein
MPTSTLTSKGQITVPRAVRDHLGVDTGDVLDFIIDPAGNVRVRAASGAVSALKGLLHKPGRPSVSLAEMDRTIRKAARGR